MSGSIVRTPVSSIAESEAIELEEASESSSYSDIAGSVLDASLSASAEEGAEAADAAEGVAAALLEAGVAGEAATSWTVIGAVVSAAALALGAIIYGLSELLKNEHCSLDILNRTSGDLVFDPDDPKSLYIEHGKQSGLPVGNVIPAGTGGNSELGIFMFSSKEYALYGTGGAIQLQLNVPDQPLAVQIAWGVPYSGDKWCNVAIGVSVAPNDLNPLELFYATSNKAKKTSATASHGSYTIQAAISTDAKERGTGTVIAVVKPS